MNEELKGKIKKVLWKMIQVPTIACVLVVSGFICYYANIFYKTNTLIFGIQDTKILLGFSVATIWSVWFCVGLMLQMNKKNDIIINQNEAIKDLITQVKTQNETTIKNTEEIIEQNDYIVNQADENYDQMIKFHKNSRQLFMERNDDIA